MQAATCFVHVHRLAAQAQRLRVRLQSVEHTVTLSHTIARMRPGYCVSGRDRRQKEDECVRGLPCKHSRPCHRVAAAVDRTRKSSMLVLLPSCGLVATLKEATRLRMNVVLPSPLSPVGVEAKRACWVHNHTHTHTHDLGWE